ncbi:MAG: hypothetical protein LUG52_02260, partial [Clostridia bacterium]|nr:hypothetical protein [Clostridia bacterium]
QNLTNVTSDNTSTETVEGSTYTANLTATDGYIIESVTVTMANLDITNTAYSNGVVNISNVNGDIVITATADAVVEKTIKINSVTVSNNSVDVDITNTLGKSGVVIVAMYDISGALLNFATTELADSTVNVDIDTTGAATVSVFIWDSVSTMIPLCGRYTQNMVDINGVTINSDSVDVDITNTLGASGVVIVAVYDADGALMDLETEDLADGTVRVSVDTTGAKTVSAYIWDGASTMIPLCDKYTVTN